MGASAVHSGASEVPVIQTGGCPTPGVPEGDDGGSRVVTPRAQSQPPAPTQPACRESHRLKRAKARGLDAEKSGLAQRVLLHRPVAGGVCKRRWGLSG